MIGWRRASWGLKVPEEKKEPRAKKEGKKLSLYWLAQWRCWGKTNVRWAGAQADPNFELGIEESEGLGEFISLEAFRGDREHLVILQVLTSWLNISLLSLLATDSKTKLQPGVIYVLQLQAESLALFN